MIDYDQFLESKAIAAKSCGFEPSRLNPRLFQMQRDVVRWGCKKGRFACFEDCGLGKTFQQLEWAHQLYTVEGVNSLILTPPAVADQTVREAKKFGIRTPVKHCRDGSEVENGITVTNYERIHKFDLSKFKALGLDESSILKSHDGKYRTMLIEVARGIPYLSAWSATPAPNDFMEIGNHAEFLGVMSRAEMLATFFVHDGGDTSKWRLKGHAEKDFWRWMCSWAVNIRKPSDLGYSDDGFTLPELRIKQVTVTANCRAAGMLFPLTANSLIERREARKVSLSDRVKASVDIANSNNEQWLVWCDLNDESRALAKAIDGAIEVTGSDDEEKRADAMLGFSDGKYRVLVSKPSIAGWGMNWQHSHNMVFCGLSDSFESHYQAIRRQYRFGQKQPVNVYIVTSDLEGNVVKNIQRKQADADRMAQEMIAHMSAISSAEIHQTTRTVTEYNPKIELQIPAFL